MKRRAFLLGLAGAAVPVLGTMPADPCGSSAPEWKVTDWLNSPPLKLADLRGKAVVVRWWTGPGCPMCATSLPVLEGWWREFRGRGLVVVGFYHHKSAAPLEAGGVAGLVKQFRVTFPVATDPGWQTLREWWFDAAERNFTSVTFLVGRDGRILRVHEGGAIEEGSKAGRGFEKAIRAALA